ncbi:hypothetical protein WMB10_04640 [Tetragenococcus halophilus]|uniref:hypothetical protein n=1 Tax=Tetragenococcus halophilus TaxID=51669 RepID=UPI00209B9536|nr:hypothetical protein [Tetragenococcus halophilus]MCO8287175.1 hypothetical protein [Tetragenococcus halophilus]
MLVSIKKMLDELEKNNIQYCHWKSNEHIRPALNGDTDLDILFLPEQRVLTDRILSECGLKRFRATPLMQYNAIEDYIGFDEKTAKIWHLHTHYRMTLGEKHLKGYTITTWGPKIIKNKIWNPEGIYTSSFEDEYIMFMVRNSLKLRWRDFNRSLGKDDVKELLWLKEKINNDKLMTRLDQFLSDVAKKEILKLTTLELSNKKQLIPLKNILRKELNVFTGYSKVHSWWLRSKRELFWLFGAVSRRTGLDTNKPNRRLSPAGGAAVAFLGSDGAGKTTTIRYVKKELGKKLDVKIIYLGSGDGSSSLLRKPMKMIAKKVGGKGLGHSVAKEYSQNNKNDVSLKGRLYSMAKIMWADTLAKEKKKKLKKVTKARNNGMIILLDRYPQIEVDGYNDGPLLSKYIKNGSGILYKKAVKEFYIYRSAYLNPPDLTLKLLVPTQIATQRKPEMSVEEIENKKAAVIKMKPSENSVIIDTSVNLTESLRNVMNEIWKVI